MFLSPCFPSPLFPGNLGTRFHITKYPTLKYVRNGVLAKREYRGQRTADAFVEFIREQTRDPVKEFTDLKEVNELDVRPLYKNKYRRPELKQFYGMIVVK